MESQFKPNFTFRFWYNEPLVFFRTKSSFDYMDVVAKDINAARKRVEIVLHSSRHEYTTRPEVINWKTIPNTNPKLCANVKACDNQVNKKKSSILEYTSQPPNQRRSY